MLFQSLLQTGRLPVPNNISAPTPYWVASPDGPHPDPLATVSRVDTGATGWPFRAVASESWMLIRPHATPPSANESIACAIVIGSNSRGRIFMPLRPIWPGLLADVAFYIAALLLIAFLFRATRAAIRRRRGSCAGCGYDLRGSRADQACPECGARRLLVAPPANNGP